MTEDGSPQETTASTPPEPTRPELDPADKLTILNQNVRNALLALPGDFKFEHSVSGIAAVDLFNLNTLMGAGIEAEVVRTLNALRKVWDPENDWPGSATAGMGRPD